MIQFQLISSSGVKFDESVYEVLVPTEAGTIAVYEDHMPILSAAAAGPLSIRRKSSDHDSAMEHFAVMGGVVEVGNKLVRFVADDVTESDELSEKEATEAYELAQRLMGDADNQVALEHAKRMLHRSSIHLQVSKLKRRHHQ